LHFHTFGKIAKNRQNAQIVIFAHLRISIISKFFTHFSMLKNKKNKYLKFIFSKKYFLKIKKIFYKIYFYK
jgi:hypothetical protein